MSTGVHRPQELICAVERGATPVLEVWFAGGSGSQRNPLLIEVLGTVDHRCGSLVCDALQQLMRRHGPWLILDLSSAAFLDGARRLMFDSLERSARLRGGYVGYAPAFHDHERRRSWERDGEQPMRQADRSVEPPPM